MAITKRNLVYTALLARVQTVVTAGGSPQMADSSVYIAAVPFLDSGMKSIYCQIIPGVGEEKQTRSGAGGLREESFDIVVWNRLFQDYGDRETELIADTSEGLMQMLAIIDGDNADPGITNMNLAAILAGSIRWLRGSAAARSPDDPGWVYGSNTYSMQYIVSRERTPT